MRLAGKIGYALLFCVLLPVLLYLWSSSITIHLPMGNWRLVGWIIATLGFAFIIWGMTDLWIMGNGLPMNAFPPTAFVASGSFRIFRHPIYTGFCSLCAGIACITHSPTMFYLITPVMIVASVALLKGFEEPDIEKRFGKITYKPFFSFPESTKESATLSEKFGASLLVFACWAFFYEGLIYFGVGNNFIDTTFPFERAWTVYPAAELAYFSIYFFVVFSMFIQKTREDLRRVSLTALSAIVLGGFIGFIVPFYTAHRPITTGGVLSDVLRWERAMDGPSAAFPSFHVIWALISALAWTTAFPKFKWLWILVALIITWSCSATGVHSIADLIAGALVFAVAYYRHNIWESLRRSSERLANSWSSFHIGNFRIINHSLYAGLAAFVGIFIVSQFILSTEVIVIITLSTLIGGAVWGQLLEGSILLRPFGYYGAIIGGITGVILCHFMFGYPFQKSIGAFALAAPWTQAIGRLRCLVQGCCHGSPSGSDGIVYVNEHSRVSKVAGLKGVRIYNTALYSIICNIVIGLFLWRLSFGGADAAMIAGIYLILNGACRFVEEHYRGEPQTKVIRKLAVYQWTAIGSMFAGAALTTIGSGQELFYSPHLSFENFVVMLCGGLLSAFAMGMDFPKSDFPFSRLTG